MNPTPTMMCDKCGLSIEVSRERFPRAEFPPDAATRWFKTHHRGCGKPVYRAGVVLGNRIHPPTAGRGRGE